MKDANCIWCLAPIKVQDTFDDLQHKAVCSQSCKSAEMLFCMYYSDTEIKHRAVWDMLKEERRAKKKAKGAT